MSKTGIISSVASERGYAVMAVLTLLSLGISGSSGLLGSWLVAALAVPVAALACWAILRPRQPTPTDDEAALSKQRLQSFFDHAPIALSLSDLHGTVQMANRATLDSYGRSPDDVSGWSYSDMIPSWQGKGMSPGGLIERMRAGKTLRFTAPFNPAGDKPQIYADMTFFPIRDDTGEVIEIGTFAIDVTEQREAREEAERSQRLLESLIDNVPIGIAVYSTEKELVLGNRAMSEFFARAPDKLADITREEYRKLTDSFDELEQAADRVLAGEGPQYLQSVPILSAAGEQHLFDTVTFPVPDASGDLAFVGLVSTDITEQRKAETNLRQSRALFEAFVQNAPNPMALMDAQGKYVMLNAATASYYDMTPEELVTAGPKYINSRFPEAKTVIAPMLGRVMASLQAETVDTKFETPSNEIRYMAFSFFPVLGGDGKLAFIGNISHDVTEERRNRAELVESRASLQAFSDNVPAGLSIKDRKRNFTMINEFSARSYYVGKPSELIGKNAESFRTRRHGDHLYAMEQQVLDTGKPESREVAYKAADGQQRHMHLMFFPILGEDGSVTHIGSLTHDITEHRQDQQELARSQAALQAFFDHLPGLAFLSSSDGIIVAANSYMAEHFGLENMRSEDLVGKRGRDLLPRSWSANADEAVEANHNSGKAFTFQQSIKTPDGIHYVSSVRFPIRNAEGETTHIGGLMFDRTTEKLAADEVNSVREGLHQSEKLAALGQLLAGVAHELNNPLAIVMGRAAMLKDKLAGTAHEDSIQRLRDAADRCARIVKTFVTMARQTGPQRTMVQIPDLVEAALDMTGHSLRSAGIELEQQIAADLPDLTADGDQLIQVLINLIINAEHAMEGQGHEPKLVIAARQEPGTGRIVVDVSDNGGGVPADLAARIFDPFFTTKDVGSGTGLGLSVCRSMIEAHGGSLELAETPGGGATFRIILPLGENEAVALSEEKPAESKPHRGTALIVDDEEEVADILAEMLTGMGLTCTIATSGKAALAVLADQEFDAIFSDVRMPRMGGSELLAAIERDHPHMVSRVIFATGDVLHAEVDALRKTGRPIVEKPYDPQQLDAALSNLFETGEVA